jgi:hypothetical protein
LERKKGDLNKDTNTIARGAYSLRFFIEGEQAGAR